MWYKIWTLLLVLPVFSWAQIDLDANERPPDSLVVDSNKIEILFIKKFKSKEKKDGTYQELLGDVHLKQVDMHLWCDSGLIKPLKQIEAFGNVQMLHADSTRLFSDSLFYYGLARFARLRDNVVLKDTSMILFTDKLDYDLKTKIATFPDGSLIESDTVTLVSKRGTYNTQTNMAHFEDSVRLTSTNYKLVADSLDFNTKTEVAYFISPTYVYHEEKTIYCENGFYDSKNEYAELKQNAWFENREEGKEEYAKGDKIIFDGKSEMYYLIGDAFYQNTEQEVAADTIIMDGKTEQYYFKGNPKFRSRDSTENQTIKAQNTNYDAETKTMLFRGEVRVEQESNVLTTDSLDYNSETKSGLARGNVVWIDTAANTKITCDVAYYNDSTKYLKAHGNPVLQSLVEGDTMWIRADTLISTPPAPVVFVDTVGQDSISLAYDSLTTNLDSNLVLIDTIMPEPKVDSSSLVEQDSAVIVTDSVLTANVDKNPPRSLKAYHRVLIYKSDMQVICDSLFYDDVDSVFNFYDDPVLWVDGTQFSADTIQVLMRTQKIHRVFLHQKSFITNTDDDVYFNQIKGDEVVTRFGGDTISNIAIEGSGETVYYAKDDEGAFVGVNDVDCMDMFLFFTANELRRIRFVDEPSAVLHPMRQVNHKSLQLEGFEWLEKFRPKTKCDVINYDSTKYILTVPMDTMMRDSFLQDTIVKDTLETATKIRLGALDYSDNKEIPRESDKEIGRSKAKKEEE